MLTYVAVVPDAEPPSGWTADEVARAKLARGSATGPPSSIVVDHVVEHGLRHLAWLVREDRVIREALRGGWEGALAGYEPEPFRSLADVGVVERSVSS